MPAAALFTNSLCEDLLFSQKKLIKTKGNYDFRVLMPFDNCWSGYTQEGSAGASFTGTGPVYTNRCLNLGLTLTGATLGSGVAPPCSLRY